jgi:uncharacterized membrane protein YciS (DUF1049 family)
MKKLNAFLFLILVILLATILLIVQNLNQITIRFLTFEISTSAGLFGIIMLLAGFIVMWLISLIVHYREISNLRRKLSDCESQINKLKEGPKDSKEEIIDKQSK